MKTKLVFKLESEPQGYGLKFSPKCKIDVVEQKGIVYLDYDKRHPVGTFENLRNDGENITADVTVFENMKEVEHRFDYSIEGSILKKNEADECEEAKIFGVAVTMPPRD
jgi:hypothetical protein